MYFSQKMYIHPFLISHSFHYLKNICSLTKGKYFFFHKKILNLKLLTAEKKKQKQNEKATLTMRGKLQKKQWTRG